nr:root phototropism protein 3-like isoform X2 [Malus domestica]
MSGLLTGGRIMRMRDAVILYHLSKNDAEQRKLDVAFIGAKYMLKLENGCSVSVANDLIIQVGDSNFYLHKLPMVMRRGYLNRLVFQRINVGRDASPRIHLDNLPRGAKVFESVVKFCYGWKFDLINIAPLYCAAHFLEMSDDFKQGNLISKTETFLSFLIFPSWKNTFRILRSCESISLCAKELKISKRSTEAIAWKACTNLNACSSETDEIQCFNVLPNNAENSRLQGAADIWWFEDVSFLRINHFIEVIQALNWKGSCIAHWTAKWLSRVTSRLERMSLKHMTHQFLGVTTECLVKDVVDGAICSKL